MTTLRQRAHSSACIESVELARGYPGPMPTPAADFTPGVECPYPVIIPAIGLTLWVRMAPALFNGAASIIETVHEPGFGPPLHRHAETEVFRVLKGSYLMQVDGRRFLASEGDVVTVPGGAAHAFVNVGKTKASQLVLITPGMQADRFFRELGQLMCDGRPAQTALDAFGHAWGVEFLGPPLAAEASLA